MRDDDLHDWAKRTFRPARMTGSPAAMRARALRASPVTASDILIAVAAIGGGYLIGREWKRSRSTIVIHGVSSRNPYLVGTIVLAAR